MNMRCVVSLAAAIACFVSAAAHAEEPSGASREISTSFIWFESEAAQKCNAAAEAENARWTGKWRTSEPGRTSLCEVVDLPPSRQARSRGRVRQVEVGPIWNQEDADVKCPRAAAQEGGRWTGHWRTTQPAVMSVCDIEYEPERRARDVEAGPIWNDADARVKCPVAAYAVRGVWTGEWRTVAQGEMSVCRIADRERGGRR